MMLRLAVTGGIASGKSTVCRMLSRFHIPIFNADETVHRLYASPEVQQWFAENLPEVMTSGQIHRPILTTILLKEPHWLEEIEAMIHPLVWREEEKFWQTQKRFGCKTTLSDMPLLIECEAEHRYDRIAVTTAPLWLRKARALRRYGMTSAKFEAMIKRQASDSVKKRAADIVIPTGAGYGETARQVTTWIKKLQGTLR
jgi:dephospho-CoA kinase